MQEGDSSEVAVLKQSMLAVMITFQERMDSAEAVQQQQTSAIQVAAPPVVRCSSHQQLLGAVFGRCHKQLSQLHALHLVSATYHPVR